MALEVFGGQFCSKTINYQMIDLQIHQNMGNCCQFGQAPNEFRKNTSVLH